VITFYRDAHYAQVKGGVYVETPEDPEQPGYPMPRADVSTGGKVETANDMGVFPCGSGNAVTQLQGPYVDIAEGCGAISESATCPDDIDLGSGGGTNCTSAGSSPGDTHAARTTFYHANRVLEKARSWIPVSSMQSAHVTAYLNNCGAFSCDPVGCSEQNCCNAFQSGNTVSFFRSMASGGCRNTGEVPSLIHHELGHFIDVNDGAGYQSPAEGYADVVAILERRDSCIAEGVRTSGFCDPNGVLYGDACLECTGYREMDWTKRQSAQICAIACNGPDPEPCQCDPPGIPATPQEWIANHCGDGPYEGPCGKKSHCESFVVSETVFDLATRDLPALGLDPHTAWQLAEELFYKSRQNAASSAYTCNQQTFEASGCGVGTWFYRFRFYDDDDGNLNNGTPHSSAIFAAFERHGIACAGAVNQDTSICPQIKTPILAVNAGPDATTLSWNAVVDAYSYAILRNDVSCDDYSFNIIATVSQPATFASSLSYVDTDLPEGFQVYYRVQALGANPACDSAVSSCGVRTCSVAADCDDGLFCNGTESCNQGYCVTTPQCLDCGCSETTDTCGNMSQCTPQCPVPHDCGGGGCQQVWPPECTITNTGNPGCFSGDDVLQCKDGFTIHKKNCDCDYPGPPPQPICLNENQSYMCRVP
jgi:hypothetical protein